jgi:hypothetical protein
VTAARATDDSALVRTSHDGRPVADVPLPGDPPVTGTVRNRLRSGHLFHDPGALPLLTSPPSEGPR